MSANTPVQTSAVEGFIQANPGYVLHSAYVDDATLRATLSTSPIIGWRVSDCDNANPIAVHSHGYEPWVSIHGTKCRFAHLVETPDRRFFDGEEEFQSIAHWAHDLIEGRKAELARQLAGTTSSIETDDPLAA
ncbi:hypothetical protein [Methylocystis parvus]|uniref:hypothetical protein n=1 Tax=Methylocystis parvus TaxID=134 RepID=UPI003C75DBF3